MQLGISTACLYPMQTEDALKLLIGKGFRDFEIFLNCESETKKDYMSFLKKILDDSGSTLYSLHPYTSAYEPHMLFSDYYRRFEDGLTLYRRYCEMAAELGAKFVVIHGDRIARPSLSMSEYFERFSVLMKIGQEFGVTVAQENVNGYRSATPEFISEMKKQIDNVKFVYDLKQEFRAGLDFLSMAKIMGGSIAHIHISDRSDKSDCLLPKFGNVDFSKLIDFCEKINYDGLFIVEVYRHNFDRDDELMQSYELLKEVNL